MKHPENPANGVYLATCWQIMEAISLRRRKIHSYQSRDGSDGNKTHSWVLDINDFKKIA
jgi:hypothetical protein